MVSIFIFSSVHSIAISASEFCVICVDVNLTRHILFLYSSIHHAAGGKFIFVLYMWIAIISKYIVTRFSIIVLYTSAGEIYWKWSCFCVFKCVCIHEWSYQFSLLICSLYCQHQKVSLHTVVCYLYILYVHGCANSGNLFSTPLLFCQHQKVNLFLFCTHAWTQKHL